MIKSFRHKGLQRFFDTGSVSGIQPKHRKRLRLLLAALDSAQSIDDMDVPGFRLHGLRGRLEGRWSIRVDRNWRITFSMQNGDVYILNYEDYH